MPWCWLGTTSISYQSQAKHKRYHQYENQQWPDFAEGLLDHQFEPLKVLVFEKLDSIIQASSLVEVDPVDQPLAPSSLFPDP